ncbi:hypothetical protein V2O64_11930 [Verrucomicrobiaceae bacterium 227]
MILGSGILRKRITSAFDQSAQMIYAKITGSTFEVILYRLRSDDQGVPGPSGMS